MKCSPSKLLTVNIYTEADQYEKEKLACVSLDGLGAPSLPTEIPKTKHLLQNELLKALAIGPIHANQGGRGARAGGLGDSKCFICWSSQPAGGVRRPSTRNLNPTNSDCK